MKLELALQRQPGAKSSTAALRVQVRTTATAANTVASTTATITTATAYNAPNSSPYMENWLVALATGIRSQRVLGNKID